MRFAESVLRKLLLAGLIFVAGPEAHMRWGQKYAGPGMNHMGLLFVVTIAAAVLAGMFLAASFAVGRFLQQRGRPWQYGADLSLFALALGLTVWMGVSAEIVDEP
jgi:hypothetical protein